MNWDNLPNWITATCALIYIGYTTLCRIAVWGGTQRTSGGLRDFIQARARGLGTFLDVMLDWKGTWRPAFKGFWSSFWSRRKGEKEDASK